MNRSTWRVYVCRHVKAGAAPLTVHVDQDGDLSATCGAPPEDHAEGAGAWSVLSWGCLLAQDATLAAVDEHIADGVVPRIWYTRTSPGAPWVIEPEDEPQPSAEAPAAAL